MAGQQTFNSVTQTGERDEDREVTEGCQVWRSVWDATSKHIRADENSSAAQNCKGSAFQMYSLC